jgi:hypothetical protein
MQRHNIHPAFSCEIKQDAATQFAGDGVGDGVAGGGDEGTGGKALACKLVSGASTERSKVSEAKERKVESQSLERQTNLSALASTHILQHPPLLTQRPPQFRTTRHPSPRLIRRLAPELPCPRCPIQAGGCRDVCCEESGDAAVDRSGFGEGG